MYNQQSHPADEGGLNKFIKMLLRKNNKFVGLNKFVQMLSREKNSYKYQSQYNKYLSSYTFFFEKIVSSYTIAVLLNIHFISMYMHYLLNQKTVNQKLFSKHYLRTLGY